MKKNFSVRILGLAAMVVWMAASQAFAGSYPSCMYWYGTDIWAKTWTSSSQTGWRLYDSDAGTQNYGFVPTSDYQIYFPSDGKTTISDGTAAKGASMIMSSGSVTVTGGSLVVAGSANYPLGGTTGANPGLITMHGSQWNISGGSVTCGAMSDAWRGSSLTFTVSNENFGTFTVNGKSRESSTSPDISSSVTGNLAFKSNASSKGVMFLDKTSNDLFSIVNGNIAAAVFNTPVVSGNLWNVAKNADNTKIELIAQNVLADYTVGSGERAVHSVFGTLPIHSEDVNYDILFAVEGVTDTNDFLTWLNNNSTPEVRAGTQPGTYLLSGLSDTLTNFAWDFSQYNAAAALASFSAASQSNSVPEPAAWLLLVCGLGLLWRRKK